MFCCSEFTDPVDSERLIHSKAVSRFLSSGVDNVIYPLILRRFGLVRRVGAARGGGSSQILDCKDLLWTIPWKLSFIEWGRTGILCLREAPQVGVIPTMGSNAWAPLKPVHIIF